MPYKTDEEFLLQAYQKAAESPDPSTQNGAVIPFYFLGYKDYVAACNDFPKGVKVTPERLQRPIKYSFVEHSERGVLYAAVKRGVRVDGMTMYVPWAACSDCARAIICSGIKKVVLHKDMMDKTPDHWQESIKYAFTMFEEAGVEIAYVVGKLGAPTIRMNGDLWTP